MKLETLWRIRAGDPWADIVHITDKATGQEVDGVTEVNTREGWLRRRTYPAPGAEKWIEERVEGDFELWIPDDAPQAAVEWFKIQEAPGYMAPGT